VLFRFFMLLFPFIKEAYQNRKDTQFGRKETNVYSLVMIEGTLLFLLFIYMSTFAFATNKANMEVHIALQHAVQRVQEVEKALEYNEKLMLQAEQRLEMMADLLDQYRTALTTEQERSANLIIEIKKLEDAIGDKAQHEPLPVPNQGYRKAPTRSNVNNLLKGL